MTPSHLATTADAIRPIIFDTYGESNYVDAFVNHLAEKITKWPAGAVFPNDMERTREDMVRLTCWEWFSGGDTAAVVARKIEDAL